MQGWCPSVFTPMAAPDGLLVRVKPRLSRLPADTAGRIADAVAAYGNGRIELTSRANLQIRGLSEAGSVAFASAMVACGVADADPATERRRNIVVSPLAGHDPSVIGHPEIVAADIALALSRAADLVLPDKFGFAVDGGGVLPLGSVGADILVRTSDDGCRVRIAGAARVIVVAREDAAELVVGLARAFRRLGGERRMRDLVDALGEDAIYAWAGSRALGAGDADVIASPSEGVIAYATPERCAYFWRPPSGELTPASLRHAADLAESMGDGLLRVTPWRGLLIGTTPSRLKPAIAA